MKRTLTNLTEKQLQELYHYATSVRQRRAALVELRRRHQEERAAKRETK